MLATESWSHDNLMTNRWLLPCGLVLIVLCCKAMCSAVFEVSLMKLHNNRGVTHDGRCCSGQTTSPPCSQPCKTFLTACLMHYTQSMPLQRTCTYGSNVTSFLGSNNINNEQDIDDEPLVQMHMEFSWPGKFTLIVEAWHDTGLKRRLYDSTQLIAQAFVSSTVTPASSWVNDTTFSPNTELTVRYRVVCTRWYHGAGCDVFCRPRDQHYGGHYNCDEDGNRICKTGWQGTFCDKPKCSPLCLRNRGTCDRPFECRCRLGWHGPNCGQCRPSAGCLRGYCLNPYQCICEDGWAGQQCDIDTRYCEKTQPCFHGGTCISDMVGNYTCTCPAGFRGDNCQFPLCYTGYCKNDGTCQTRRGARECVCTDDFYGDHCEHEVLTCAELDCKHGGTCSTGKYGATCQCAEGYTGKRCESKINPCSSDPCENDAECREDDMSKHGFMCICSLGFGGLYCSIKIDPCSGYTCYNSGKCRYKKNHEKPYCQCRRGYHGEFCENTIDPCKHVACENGGSCKPAPMGNGFICACMRGYHGEVCESEMNPCESSPCQNGGKCKNYISTFLCLCADGYSGKYCESEKFVVVEKKVRNNAQNDVTQTDDVVDDIVDNVVRENDATLEDAHAEVKDHEAMGTNGSGTISRGFYLWIFVLLFGHSWLKLLLN